MRRALLVYHDQRLLEGPGYPGGFLGEPVRDPVAVFRAGCGQVMRDGKVAERRAWVTVLEESDYR
jgi:hypothetical protein